MIISQYNFKYFSSKYVSHNCDIFLHIFMWMLFCTLFSHLCLPFLFSLIWKWACIHIYIHATQLYVSFSIYSVSDNEHYLLQCMQFQLHFTGANEFFWSLWVESMAHQLLFRHRHVVTHDNRQAITPQIPLNPSEFVRDGEISSGMTRWKRFFQESEELLLSAAFVRGPLTFLTGKLNGKRYSAAFHTQIDRLCLAGHIKLQEFDTLVCCLSRPSVTKRWCLFPVRAMWAVQTSVYGDALNI